MCKYVFCNVLVFVNVCYVMCGFVYVWVLRNVNVCKFGVCNVWECKCGVCNVWVCVIVGFVMCGCVYV